MTTGLLIGGIAAAIAGIVCMGGWITIRWLLGEEDFD